MCIDICNWWKFNDVNYAYMLCWCCYCIVLVELMLLFRELSWWSWWWAELREGHVIYGFWLCLKWHMECRKWLELAKMWIGFNRAKLDFCQLIFNAHLPYQMISEHSQIWHLNTLWFSLQFLCFGQILIPTLGCLNLQFIFIVHEPPLNPRAWCNPMGNSSFWKMTKELDTPLHPRPWLMSCLSHTTCHTAVPQAVPP